MPVPRPTLLALAASATLAVPILIGTLNIRAQDPTTSQHFDAADIHPSRSAATDPYTWASGGLLRGGRYDLHKATMLDLIKTAWNVDPDTILGGPNWLELNRYDVDAKAPANTSPETIRLMLQDLLKARFGLTLHQGAQPMPAFALTAGKTPKLTRSDGAESSGCERQSQPGTTFAVYACRNITMDAFAQSLRRLAPDYLNAPITNATNLEGSWNFDLQWNGRARALPPDTNRTTIFNALDQQLGLKLSPTTKPAPVLVVDAVNETPTPNPPDTAKLLPPGPTEFEVAAIRPSRPDEPRGGARLDSGRIEFRGVPLNILLMDGFDIPTAPTTWDESHLIAGLPKWAFTERFDINAKLPADAYAPPGASFTDDFRLMLKNLLIERFQLKYHYEARPIPAYTLVAAKPKMKKADPTHRPNCKEARVLANDPRDTNPRLNRLVTCQNVTTTQFAALLADFARIYVDTPVEDATALRGSWDFTLSFSDPNLLNTPEPDGAISLEEAINNQLGLKLEKRRRPVSILVVDHVEEHPTRN